MIKILSSNGCNGKHKITYETDNEETIQAIDRAMMGHAWIRCDFDGNIRTVDAYKTPSKVTDVQLELHWKTGSPVCIRPGKGNRFDPSIYVQHLQGYSDNYEEKVELMEKAGFDVLRSRRGLAGMIWEIWYLPGKWAAKGPIKGKNTEQIRKWLFRNIRPGTVEIGGEHWGLSID
jgi:hypothetical protein